MLYKKVRKKESYKLSSPSIPPTPGGNTSIINRRDPQRVMNKFHFDRCPALALPQGWHFTIKLKNI